jgi:hypothetical protein
VSLALLLTGDAPREIVYLAKDSDAGLVVMGSSGLGDKEGPDGQRLGLGRQPCPLPGSDRSGVKEASGTTVLVTGATYGRQNATLPPDHGHVSGRSLPMAAARRARACRRLWKRKSLAGPSS